MLCLFHSCIRVLHHDPASWSCIIVLHQGPASGSCIMVLHHGSASRSCIVIMSLSLHYYKIQTSSSFEKKLQENETVPLQM